MAKQLRLPRAVKIGMLIALFLFAYLAGKFDGLPGNTMWWIFKVCSLASSGILFLLLWETWKGDG